MRASTTTPECQLSQHRFRELIITAAPSSGSATNTAFVGNGRTAPAGQVNNDCVETFLVAVVEMFGPSYSHMICSENGSG